MDSGAAFGICTYRYSQNFITESINERSDELLSPFLAFKLFNLSCRDPNPQSQLE